MNKRLAGVLVLAAMLAGCSTDEPAGTTRLGGELAPHTYSLTITEASWGTEYHLFSVDPTGKFSGWPGYELSDCHGQLTDEQLGQLTSTLNAGNMLAQEDHLRGCNNGDSPIYFIHLEGIRGSALIGRHDFAYENCEDPLIELNTLLHQAQELVNSEACVH